MFTDLEAYTNLTYAHHSRLCIITTYYNPCGYITRRDNFNRFIAPIITSGISYIVVEAAFGNDPFTLFNLPGVVQVRARDCMWQKEALLNIALSHTPAHCDIIVWLDSDILFENPNWTTEVVEKLSQHSIVQVFETCTRVDTLGESPQTYPSFGKTYQTYPMMPTSEKWQAGYGWATRKDVLKLTGFYPYAILGSGDRLMALASIGEINVRHPFYLTFFGPCQAFYNHFQQYAKGWYQTIQGNVGYVSGSIFHLWHGNTQNRQYTARHKILHEYNFNPQTFIEIERSGALKWKKPNLILQEKIQKYFIERQEDRI